MLLLFFVLNEERELWQDTDAEIVAALALAVRLYLQVREAHLRSCDREREGIPGSMTLAQYQALYIH